MNSVEIFGYDFMVDENFNCWIVEINKSPTLEASTVKYFIKAVTKSLVYEFQEDIIKVIVDYGMCKKSKRKNIDTGHFKCIYKEK